MRLSLLPPLHDHYSAVILRFKRTISGHYSLSEILRSSLGMTKLYAKEEK